jgi:YesN/AraC family two-component response regulator
MVVRKKLIYIDDEEPNLVLFELSFKEKFDVYTSKSPLEGIEIIKKEKISVVITDYKMPGMSGMELINQIKKFQPETICMILSAYVENEVITDKTKIFKYILKPYRQSELLQYIEDAFKLCVA